MSDKVEEYLKNAEKIGRQYGNCKEFQKYILCWLRKQRGKDEPDKK